MDKDVKTVMATVLTTAADRITAFDNAGLIHTLFWNGKSAAYRGLRPGDLVIVHYTPSFDGQVHAFELPPETSPAPQGDEEGYEDA